MKELLSPGTGSGAPVAVERASTAPRAPSARRPRARERLAWAAGGVVAVILISAGAAAGLWFVPFLAGLAAGVAARRARLRAVLPAVVGAAVAGWAVPLAWQAAGGEPVGATASAVGALAGLPPSAALVLGVTLLIAAIQAVTGLWLARAVARPRMGA
jgi:hypothetical protein